MNDTTWQDLDGSSMRYLLSLPKDWSPGKRWPVMVVVTGSNSNFEVIQKGYVQARGDLPFIVVTVASVSSGSKISPERYPHLPEEEREQLASADLATKLAYDAQGLQLTLADLRERFGAEDKVYLSGFSMGGLLLWHTAYHHAADLHIAFPVCALYPENELADVVASDSINDPDLPVFGFQGKGDPMIENFAEHWAAARRDADTAGLTNFRLVETWRKHSWHNEEILFLCYGHYLGRSQ